MRRYKENILFAQLKETITLVPLKEVILLAWLKEISLLEISSPARIWRTNYNSTPEMLIIQYLKFTIQHPNFNKLMFKILIIQHPKF